RSLRGTTWSPPKHVVLAQDDRRANRVSRLRVENAAKLSWALRLLRAPVRGFAFAGRRFSRRLGLRSRLPGCFRGRRFLGRLYGRLFGRLYGRLFGRLLCRLFPLGACCFLEFSLWRVAVLADLGLFLYILLFRFRLGDGSRRRQSLEASARSRLDAGSLADAVAQVVEARAPDTPNSRDVDLLDERRVEGEDALDADAVAYAAYGEAGACSARADADDDAFEDLDPLAVALDDFGVDADGVARPKVADFGVPLEVDVGFRIHGTTTSV